MSNVDDRVADIKAEQAAREKLDAAGWILEDPTGEPARGSVVYHARRRGSATSEERQSSASLSGLIRAVENANDRRERQRSDASPVPVTTGLSSTAHH